MNKATPSIVVFTSLFPSSVRQGAGLFIRERMFRVARHLPLTVVSPQPWSPIDALIRRFFPRYRPVHPRKEQQQGITVYFPRFFALPAVARWLDGWSMAWSARAILRHLSNSGKINVIDSHFAYPDGFAAAYLGKALGLPVTITLRGTEPRTANYKLCGKLQARAMRNASRVFSVASALLHSAREAGVPEDRLRVIGNGVDDKKFQPVNRADARRELGLPENAHVLVTVGGLVERKGFHRVIELLPSLSQEFPDLHYLVIGGPSPEGDWTGKLKAQVKTLGLENTVHFLGQWLPSELKRPLSASDVFVLATRNEGWANVFLEAMACGLPVVTTDVGGNREVVDRAELGFVVPFGNREALYQAIADALRRSWCRSTIREHAEKNSWDSHIAELLEEFRTITG